MASLLMTTIYLLIVFTPLAPLAMQSKIVAHAVTGECSGDCKVDGCSLERSAAHTCCCWQKKNHAAADNLFHADSDVRCIPPAPMVEAPKMRAGCCDAPAQGSLKKSGSAHTATPLPTQKTKKHSVGNAPCGNGTLFAVLSSETTQHLPYVFTGDTPSPEQSPLVVVAPGRLTSRYIDPPVPPPIISFAS